MKGVHLFYQLQVVFDDVYIVVALTKSFESGQPNQPLLDTYF
jgi:hypothetical protein